MHIVFRCDSTRQQGLGHVFRCVSAADAAIALEHTVEFLGAIDSQIGVGLLTERGYRLTFSEDGSAAAVASFAKQAGADVVHIDTYAPQEGLYEALRAEGILMSSVEDGTWGRRRADLVVDSSPRAQETFRPADGSRIFLRGVQAVALRDELLVQAQIRSGQARLEKLRSRDGEEERTDEAEDIALEVEDDEEEYLVGDAASMEDWDSAEAEPSHVLEAKELEELQPWSPVSLDPQTILSETEELMEAGEEGLLPDTPVDSADLAAEHVFPNAVKEILAGISSRLSAAAEEQGIVPEMEQQVPENGEAAVEAPVKVLVIMGGTDARRMGPTAAHWCAEAARIASDRNGLSTDITLVSADSSVEIDGVERIDPSPDVAQLYAQMDLVVTGAGTTVWELAALGVPMAQVQLVDNQLENYEFSSEHGIALPLGSVAESSPCAALDAHGVLDLAPDQRREAVEALADLFENPERRQCMATAGRALVDGEGGERAAVLWTLLKEGAALAPTQQGWWVRRATLDDASQLFTWRNDPVVRSMSRETGELVWAEHFSWVRNTMQREDRMLLIVEHGGEVAGTVRFDEEDPGIWEVSITLDAAQRGKGHAKPLLLAAEQFFATEFFSQNPTSDALQLVAEMLESNPASHRLFLSAGYAGEIKPVEPGQARWHRLEKHFVAPIRH